MHVKADWPLALKLLASTDPGASKRQSSSPLALNPPGKPSSLKEEAAMLQSNPYLRQLSPKLRAAGFQPKLSLD